MSIIAAAVLAVLFVQAPAVFADAPSGAPVETPHDASVDPPNETPAAAPGEPAAETPREEPAEAPGQAPNGTPADPPAEPAPETPDGTDPPSDAPADSPGEAPAGAPGQPPAETPDAAPDAAPADAAADPFSAVRRHLVVVKDGLDAAANRAPGFGVSGDGHVLTHARGFRDVPSYVVTTSGGQVFQAAKVASDEPTGLVLLRIGGSGHGLTPLPFARTALQPADPLHAVRFDPSGAAPFTTVSGTVTRLFAADDGWPAIAHNALFAPTSAGTPLLNRCHQAVGVNVLERQGFFGREVDPTEQGSARSVASSHVRDLLASAGLALPTAEGECPSLEEETRRRLERAQQEKERIRQEKEAAETRAAAQAEEARRKEAALQAEKDAAEQRAARGETETAAQRQRAEEEARRAAEAAQRLQEEAQRKQEAEEQARLAAERARLREEEARQAEERKRQTLQYAAIGGGALALAVLALLLVVRAKRKRLAAAEREKTDMAGDLDRAQSELSAASERDRLRASAPDVFLDGADARGHPIALKIPGASLVEPAGAVVGRSPADATFVINHEQVSRRHFRLALVAQRVTVEDLGSTNGTSVDGARLAPGDAVPLADGNRLALGDLHLTVRTGR